MHLGIEGAFCGINDLHESSRFSHNVIVTVALGQMNVASRRLPWLFGNYAYILYRSYATVLGRTVCHDLGTKLTWQFQPNRHARLDMRQCD